MNIIRQTRGAARALKISIPLACLFVAASSVRADVTADVVAGYAEKEAAANTAGAALIGFGIVVAVIFFLYRMVKR